MSSVNSLFSLFLTFFFASRETQCQFKNPTYVGACGVNDLRTAVCVLLVLGFKCKPLLRQTKWTMVFHINGFIRLLGLMSIPHAHTLTLSLSFSLSHVFIFLCHSVCLSVTSPPQEESAAVTTADFRHRQSQLGRGGRLLRQRHHLHPHGDAASDHQLLEGNSPV